MNNFVNFLLDYYLWILVILGIVIVTIIGFLVDSKQKRKRNESKQQSNSLNEVKTVEPFPNTNENIGINSEMNEQSLLNNMSNVGDTNIVHQTQLPISQNIGMSATNTVNANLIQDGMINNTSSLSLSEQKPHFETREVVMPKSTQQNLVNNEKIAVPRPINAVSINQPLPQQTLQSQIPQQNVTYTQPIQKIHQNYPTNINGAVQQNDRVMNYNNNFVNSQNLKQINSNHPITSSAVQSPVNYQNNMVSSQNVVSQPQVVSSVQPVSETNNFIQQQPLNYNNNTVGVANSQSTVNQPLTQTVSSTPNIGISFVTGNNSNSNEDNWNL